MRSTPHSPLDIVEQRGDRGPVRSCDRQGDLDVRAVNRITRSHPGGVVRTGRAVRGERLPVVARQMRTQVRWRGGFDHVEGECV